MNPGGFLFGNSDGLLFGNPGAVFRLLLLIILCACACRSDLTRRKISNRLVLPVLVAGVAGHMLPNWPGMSGAAPGAALSGMVFALAGGDSVLARAGFALAGAALPLLLLPLWLAGAMGAGDIKLLMSAGACLGAPGSAAVILASLLAEGAFGIPFLLWRILARRRTGCKGQPDRLDRPAQRSGSNRPAPTSATRIPMAPFISFAAVCVCLLGCR